jgi:hypothetical protein
VFDPVSYGDTCFDCAFESVESMISFTQQGPVTCCAVRSAGSLQRHRLLRPLLRTFVLADPD